MHVATCFFLQERYLASLMPLKRDISPWRVSDVCCSCVCLWVSVIDDNCRHVIVTRSASSRAETVQRGAFSKNGGRSGTADYLNNQGKLDSSLQVNIVMATVNLIFALGGSRNRSR